MGEELYRVVNVTCGLGYYPTQFESPVVNTKTDNNAVKLCVDFPDAYINYRKIIDIGYFTASAVYNIESYEMTYEDDIDRYVFYVDRQFSYGNKAYFQFRALHVSGQEVVDPMILFLRFFRSIKSVDFASIDASPSGTQTEILEDFVQQHGNVNASTIHTGHVRIDNETVFITASGVLSAAASEEFVLGDHIDNVTIVINDEDIISAVTTTLTSYLMDVELNANGVLNLDDYSLLADVGCSVIGGKHPNNTWYFYNLETEMTGEINSRTASYKFPYFMGVVAGSKVEDVDGYSIVGAFQLTEYEYILPWPSSLLTGDFDVRAIIEAEFVDNLIFHISTNVSGGTAPYDYKWYLGPITDYENTPNVVFEFPIDDLEDLYGFRIKLIVTDSEGRKLSTGMAFSLFQPPTP